MTTQNILATGLGKVRVLDGLAKSPVDTLTGGEPIKGLVQRLRVNRRSCAYPRTTACSFCFSASTVFACAAFTSLSVSVLSAAR